MTKTELNKLYKKAEIARLNLLAIKARNDAIKARKLKANKQLAMPIIKEDKFLIDKEGF